MKAPKYKIGQVIKATKHYPTGQRTIVVAGSIQNIYWSSSDDSNDKRGEWVYVLQLGDNGLGYYPMHTVYEGDDDTTTERLA
jgi:hypothetical protein